jgi:hypothetical protein
MKIIKHFTVVLLCVAISLMLVVPITAAEPNDSNGEISASADNGSGTNENNGNELNGNNGTNGGYPNGDNSNGGAITDELGNRISELEAQLMALWSIISAQPEVDHWAIDRQIAEAAELERYMFQIKYYSVCLTIANNNLLNRQRTLTERQLRLERVRLELGFSTQRDVNDINAAFNSINRQIEHNNEIVRISREHINTRRSTSGYGFIGNFGIPAPASPNARSAEELRRGLVNNNTSLFVLERQINQLNRQNVPWAEVRLLQEQRELLVRQLEMVAINSWSAYLDARTQHDLAVALRPLLESRLNLIDEMFRLGEISEVERMEQRFSAYEELHRLDITAIMLVIAVAELDFMMKGIMPQ